MHILIAPNAFKNSLTAQAAAKALQRGLLKSKLHCTTECFPIADGGDGTSELILHKCNGTLVNMTVNDPLGRPITASYGLIDYGTTAVIEMASASGLRLLKSHELNPMQASSYGTGQMLLNALDGGVDKIILAMGGSATVDGGCGILSALGVLFLDVDGNALKPIPASLVHLTTIDTSKLDVRVLNTEIVVICDVDNRLLGDKGAAAVFGPQKGASPDDVKQLETVLSRFNEITLEQFGKNMAELKYGGAAGGSTAGIHAFLNAQLVNGIDYFLKLTNFEASLQKADIVITGEGSIDEQTLQGKGPFGVAKLAKQHNIKVIGVAGKVPDEPSTGVKEYFDELISINKQPIDLPTALKNTNENLVKMGKEIGELLANKKPLSF
ncbi:MAG: glycerate kinase [Sphingobacteriaceae bacterium]|nr:MAG: glycerate kinase [Sphingobacteriaceae bacterium]